MKIFTASVILLCLLFPGAARAVPTVDPSPAAVERSVPPRPTGPAPDLKLPNLRVYRLDNGIPVYTAVMPGQLNESICIIFPQAGAKNDPAGKYGLSYYVNNLLARGTERCGYAELEKKSLTLGAVFSPLGVSWGCIDWDIGGVAVNVVRFDNLPEIVSLLADTVRHPAFSPQELERLKTARFAQKARWRTSSLFVGETAFNRFVFGEGSRYGTALRADTSAQEATIDRADIMAFYKQNCSPRQAFFLCCGPLTPEELAEQLNKHFGSWQDCTGAESGEGAIRSDVCRKARADAVNNQEPRYIPEMASGAGTPMDGRIVIVDRPQEKTARVWVGCPGISVNDPDLLAAEAMNTVLGNCGVIDRLNANLRESKGYTYGVRSEFEKHLDRGAFKVTGYVQTDRAIPAVQEIFKEMALMRRPLPEAELRKFLTDMAYGFPKKFDAAFSYRSLLTEILLGYYPKDYADTYVSEVMKLTPADVQKAAERILEPDKMIVVIVGDAKALEPQLKEAGWRAQVLTVDEVMGPKMTAE